MRFSFWPAPTNSWNDTLDLANHAEATGWYSIWFADHFMPNAEDTSGPFAECWTTLAALGAAVPRVRIGALVTGNTYRHPAVLAKMAANVDQISGGRCVLGLGAGWQENEHRAYGLNFSTLGGRMARFDYLIAGAGGAGLSLAVHLSRARPDAHLLIVDKNPHDLDQRNLSWWSDRPTLFDGFARGTWRHLDLCFPEGPRRVDLGRYRYRSLAGRD